MEGGGVESESELSSIAAMFALDRLLRVDERVGVSLEESDFLFGVEEVEALGVPAPWLASFSVGFGRLERRAGEER
jgi:hypothetical protein